MSKKRIFESDTFDFPLKKSKINDLSLHNQNYPSQYKKSIASIILDKMDINNNYSCKLSNQKKQYDFESNFLSNILKSDLESKINQNLPIGPKDIFLENFFDFEKFNPIQKNCLIPLIFEDLNMVISSPTGSGKTVLFELAILRKLILNNKIMNISKKPQNLTEKFIYIAPIKALCQEKTNEWTHKFSNILKVLEITGDNNELEDHSDFLSANLLITTPEKWDSITRKWRDNSVLISQISLLLIDEVHLLNTEERGGTLEAVVSRMRIISQEINRQKLRIIALSATIPNIEDIAEWLEVSKSNIKTFGEEYRPVLLEKYVFGYNNAKSEFIFEKNLNYKLLDIIRKFSEKRPSLVFCQTQKGTITACEQLMSSITENEFVANEQHHSILLQYSSQIIDNHLKRFISFGIGFHNARLKAEDRQIIEFLFKERMISVICTTSTLAQGINLPARLVIIKSTSCYRGAGIGYNEYSQLEIEQMMGRAGRPQFDNKGVVVIMTKKEKVEEYTKFKRGDPLESHFSSKLAEHLNAEISLQAINSIDTAVKYLESTFFFVRVKKNPEFYQFQKNKISLNNYISNVCNDIIAELSKYDLVSFDKTKNNVKSLDLGNEMSRFFVDFLSVKVLFENYANKLDSHFSNLERMIETLSKAHEFEKFRSKLEDRGKLKILNEKNRFKVKGAIASSDKKIFVLLQSWIQRESLDDWEFIRDSNEIVSISWRLLNLFRRFFFKKKQPLNLIMCYNLSKFISSRTWENSVINQLRQIPGIGEKIAQNLVQKEIINLKKLKILNENQIDKICGKNYPFGKNVKDFLMKIPEIHIDLIHENEKINLVFKNFQKELICNANLVIYNEKKSVFISRFMNLKQKTNDFNLNISIEKKEIFPIHINIIIEKYIGFDKDYIIRKDFILEENLIKNEDINNINSEKENEDNEIIDSKKLKLIDQMIEQAKLEEENSKKQLKKNKNNKNEKKFNNLIDEKNKKNEIIEKKQNIINTFNYEKNKKNKTEIIEKKSVLIKQEIKNNSKFKNYKIYEFKEIELKDQIKNFEELTKNLVFENDKIDKMFLQDDNSKTQSNTNMNKILKNNEINNKEKNINQITIKEEKEEIIEIIQSEIISPKKNDENKKKYNEDKFKDFYSFFSDLF